MQAGRNEYFCVTPSATIAGLYDVTVSDSTVTKTGTGQGSVKITIVPGDVVTVNLKSPAGHAISVRASPYPLPKPV